MTVGQQRTARAPKLPLMATHTVQLSTQVYEHLESLSKFDDRNPNDVLERMLGLQVASPKPSAEAPPQKRKQVSRKQSTRERKTEAPAAKPAQQEDPRFATAASKKQEMTSGAYRLPMLEFLAARPDGVADKSDIVEHILVVLADQLGDADRLLDPSTKASRMWMGIDRARRLSQRAGFQTTDGKGQWSITDAGRRWVREQRGEQPDTGAQPADDTADSTAEPAAADSEDTPAEAPAVV